MYLYLIKVPDLHILTCYKHVLFVLLKVEKINWFTLSTKYKADTCGHENENLTVITKDSLLFYPVITITICTQHTKYLHPTNDIMCFLSTGL